MRYSENQPLVSFCLFAYNQELFIKEAILGAFSQTYLNLEIILSDDCSTDRTFEIITEMADNYTGLHSIILNHNDKNLGIAGHINKVMEIANGELIVVAAGDDISEPKRTEIITKKWLDSDKKMFSLFSDMNVISSQGYKVGEWNTKVKKTEYSLDFLMESFGTPVFGASHAWSKFLFDFFGPIDEKIIHEDWVVPFRASLLGPIKHIPEHLVIYRRHSNNTYKTEMPSEYNLIRKNRYLFVDEKINTLSQWIKDAIVLKDKYDELNICNKLLAKNELNNIVKDIAKQIDNYEMERKLRNDFFYLIRISNFFKIAFKTNWKLKYKIFVLIFYFFPRTHYFYKRYSSKIWAKK